MVTNKPKFLACCLVALKINRSLSLNLNSIKCKDQKTFEMLIGLSWHSVFTYGPVLNKKVMTTAWGNRTLAPYTIPFLRPLTIARMSWYLGSSINWDNDSIVKDEEKRKCLGRDNSFTCQLSLLSLKRQMGLAFPPDSGEESSAQVVTKSTETISDMSSTYYRIRRPFYCLKYW